MTPYSLYSGCGNTFFIVDNRERNVSFSKVIPSCQKKNVDGVIALELGEKAPFRMRIFNPDGSEAEMCGNGLRCLAKFINQMDIHEENIEIEAKAGRYLCRVYEEEVSVSMTLFPHFKWHLKENLHFLNTGVPHAVLFYDSIEEIDVLCEGRKFRFDPLFGYSGANVDFVCLLDKQNLSMRTYERGVERETLACGTGAIAAAIAAAYCFFLPSPLFVHFGSKEKLKITFSRDFKEIEMSGPAVQIETGTLECCT